LPEQFGDDSSVQRQFRWRPNGNFERIWAVLVVECDNLQPVDWKRQAADGRPGKVRLGGRRWEKKLSTSAEQAPNSRSWSKVSPVH
jgi:hypothetical protein